MCKLSQKTFLNLLILTGFFFSLATQASLVESFKHSEISQIRSNILFAKSLTNRVIKNFYGKKWTCTIYKITTSTKKSDQIFYSFDLEEDLVSGSKNKIIENIGRQFVKSYKKSLTGLEGHIGPYLDVVRLNRQGQLLAELSVPAGKSKNTNFRSVFNNKRFVHSYAKCELLKNSQANNQ